MPLNWQDIKAGSVRPTDHVEICLRGDLAAAYADAARRLAAAQDSDDDSINGGLEALQVAEEMAALREEMEQHTFRFTCRALPRHAYRELCEAHPPREGHPSDRLYGVDMSAFPLPLIAGAVVAITPAADGDPVVAPDAEPVLTLDDVREMDGQLTEGQMQSLFGCAARINKTSVDLPKSATASELMATHAPSSKRPAPGA
ncbi:hypothetical protein [Spongiactinospora sp. TRM90649]|uniref:hypothetical protein n=1 Tax=Spongiactinospora sp. TRM90649 TaxID=3031114 RepID=UPI0023F8C84D|nr:hypothetical protein [Spongiactinospora sp. TRM90649]MDF5758619.1 hypothetical protein [Spongiactinospora sp. TRM90649]